MKKSINLKMITCYFRRHNVPLDNIYGKWSYTPLYHTCYASYTLTTDQISTIRYNNEK